MRLTFLGSASPRTALIVLALGLLAPAMVSAIRGFPLPAVQDEFSRLLAADTFARGRLTNPTPPAAQSFLSPHVLLQPSYQSKYFPGEALFYAAGQALFGHPAYGLWLVCGLAAVSLWWMLLRFTRPRWALLGTLLMVLTVGSHSYWSQSYWGGMLPFAGAALVASVLGRPGGRRARLVGAAAFGVGAALLMLSRPFEGALFTAPILLLHLSPQDGSAGRIRWPSPSQVLAWSLPLLLAGGFQLALNDAVTGSWTRLPYAEHQQRYASVPNFGFSSPERPLAEPSEPLTPRLQRLETAYTQTLFGLASFDWRLLQTRHSVWRLLQLLTGDSVLTSVPMLLLFAFTPWLLGRRGVRQLLLVSSFLAAGRLVTWNHGHSHYLAPLGPVIYLVLVEALRVARTLRPGLSHGRSRFWTSLVVIPVAVGWLVAFFGQADYVTHAGSDPQGFPFDRARAEEFLGQKEGRHLALVSYAPGYSLHNEWVYNGAQIDERRVVFAHLLDAQANATLLEHSCDRTVWRVDVAPRGPLEITMIRPPCSESPP